MYILLIMWEANYNKALQIFEINEASQIFDINV